MLKKRNYHIGMNDINMVNKTIGKNVKLLRIANNLTQEQLAEIVGLERKSITAIETGRTFISCEVLVNLSNYFKVEPSFFFIRNIVQYTDKEVNLKKDINNILSNFNEKKLKSIYNIIIALQD